MLRKISYPLWIPGLSLTPKLQEKHGEASRNILLTVMKITFTVHSSALKSSRLCKSPIYKLEEHGLGKDPDMGEVKHKPLGLLEGRWMAKNVWLPLRLG